MHCTLESPPTEISESWIRVGTKKYSWRTGECIVFDETCEHEVFFSCGETICDAGRVVLILDFANPFLQGFADYLMEFPSDIDITSLKLKFTNFQTEWKTQRKTEL
jgi:aspartyl/asparaginyl beta-hydroxylase (cupin superfamily)